VQLPDDGARRGPYAFDEAEDGQYALDLRQLFRNTAPP
jgi:hypothetical protein